MVTRSPSLPFTHLFSLQINVVPKKDSKWRRGEEESKKGKRGEEGIQVLLPFSQIAPSLYILLRGKGGELNRGGKGGEGGGGKGHP